MQGVVLMRLPEYLQEQVLLREAWVSEKEKQ